MSSVMVKMSHAEYYGYRVDMANHMVNMVNNMVNMANMANMVNDFVNMANMVTMMNMVNMVDVLVKMENNVRGGYGESDE